MNSYDNADSEAYRVAYLIAGFIRNTLTDQEEQELDDWVNASDHNMLLFEDLTDRDNIETNLEMMDKVQAGQSYRQLQEKGAFNKPANNKVRILWLAAAAVLIIAGVFILYRIVGNDRNSKQELVEVDSSYLQPGGNRATLTLSDGSVIDLRAVKNGAILSSEGSGLSKPADGKLVYGPGAPPEAVTRIHTLSTPAGGQYQVTLPDGTRVWLNASTTLKYPARFVETERRVEINGEAYFEVAKNEAQPFQVGLSDGSTVNVLGTHFNVMSYNNEDVKEVTLVEGRVLVNSKGKTAKLLPGMQAKIAGNDLKKEDKTDIEEITGWKNGLFVFHDAPIESIMRQVERWYDAKVVFRGEIRQLFNASILRKEPLSKLLHLLELNGYVKFKIENNTIYVSP